MTRLHYVGNQLSTFTELQSATPDNYSIGNSDFLSNTSLQGELILFDAACVDQFGLQNCKHFVQLAKSAGIPVIMVWSDSADHQLLAIDCGCADYLCSPFHRSILLSKAKIHRQLASTDHLFTEQQQLLENARSSYREELLSVQEAIILSMSALARIKDHSTGDHILRTQYYVKALAERLRYHPDFAEELDDDQVIDLLYKTASLHDIGKVAIPDKILQKPDKLSAAEYEIMKQHPRYGFQALCTAESLLRKPTETATNFFRIGRQVTLSHHEHWDGSGYPEGLCGNQIPIVARIMAVADVYDAIVSRRPYKNAHPHSLAVNQIVAGKGTLFDPVVVDAFTELADTFEKISVLMDGQFPHLSDLTLQNIEDLITQSR
ncbi:HD domain-containing protein [Motiliproteus sp. MSK22-1]|uniref:HD domain-containing protein n=1 Tax=Motiliproteus sp. MSK22-1 TaxID=1897630 RepID=UPI000975E814|nr:HD domain-containing phosphohydrolase [Motiliproteus sp. MSK22-1]OMH39506.1 hypothetical protein BGP75_02635 [Motiliproteus sp. MSK22-1]